MRTKEEITDRLNEIADPQTSVLIEILVDIRDRMKNLVDVIERTNDDMGTREVNRR